MLKSNERAKLKGLATNLPDLVYVGINGINDNIIKQVNDNLVAHELIKIKVQRGSQIEPKDIANSLATSVDAEVVGVIGSKIILYKHSKTCHNHYCDLF